MVMQYNKIVWTCPILDISICKNNVERAFVKLALRPATCPPPNTHTHLPQHKHTHTFLMQEPLYIESLDIKESAGILTWFFLYSGW